MILTHIGISASSSQAGRPACSSRRHGDPAMPSLVAEIAAATPDEVGEHYARRLAFETDCWDVHESLRLGASDFVLLDVRGPRLYERAHVPGALSLPHGKMTASRMAEWPAETLFVVYCAGPH